jgi:plastocyanin
MVTLRGGHPLLYRAALAVVAVSALVLPASANGQAPGTATVTAIDGPPRWEPSSADLALGGTVTFAYPMGGSAHSVTFVNPPASPSCSPAWPTAVLAAPWTAACSFNTAGTYYFLCGVPQHTGMTGTIVVAGPGTPTPPPPPPPPTTPPPGGSPSEPGSVSVKVARRQRGTIVRGSVTTSVDGSRLAIRALVSNRQLAKSRPRRIRNVSVGSLRRLVASAGKTSFALKLNAAARRALNRRDRLTVNLRITATPPGGAATTKTARVTLRPA